MQLIGSGQNSTRTDDASNSLSKSRVVAMSVHPIAMLSAEEFERGREIIPELSRHQRYEDWVACREGLLIDLSSGGLESRFVSVSLEDFLRWCDARAVPPSEPALDAFALLSEFFGSGQD